MLLHRHDWSMTRWIDRILTARRSRSVTARRRREVLGLVPALVDEAAASHWSSRELIPVIDVDALGWINDTLVRFPGPSPVFEASIRLANPAADETFYDLPSAVRVAVTEVLTNATTTANNATLCLWEGYGYPWNDNPSSLALIAPAGADPGPWPWPALPTAIRRGPKAVPADTDRGFVVFAGPVRSLHRIDWRITDHWCESHWPDIAYPRDRAWLSYSDIDEDTIDIHGSVELIEQLRRIDGLNYEIGFEPPTTFKPH